MSTYKDVDQLKLYCLVQINLCEQGKKMAELNTILYHQLDAAIGAYSAVIQNIDAQPTADVEEVRHGKWEEVEVVEDQNVDIASMRCPVCNRYKNHVYHYGNPTDFMNYCSFCGAKMDGGEKGNGED